MIKLFLPLIFLALTSCQEYMKKDQPKAVNGAIDLSTWNFEKSGEVKLAGDWEFYWHKLYTPEMFKPEKKLDGYSLFPHPHLWKAKKGYSQNISKFGYATYRLNVKLPKGKTNYGIKFIYSLSNHTLFVDGKRAISDGVVGTSRKSSTPSNRSKFYYFVPKSNEVELVLQMSNYSMTKGGSHRALIIGAGKRIKAFNRTSTITNTFIIGSTFIMAIYHIALFAIRRKDPTPFFFGLFCLVISIRSGFTSNAEIFYTIFPDISWTAVKRITYVTLFLSPTAILSFVCISDKNKITRYIPHGAWAVAAIFTLITLFTEPLFFTKTILAFQIVVLVEILLAMSILVHATYKRILGAGFILTGGAFFSAGAIHDVLGAMGVFNGPELSHIGLYIFVLMQALVISFRYSRVFMDVEIALQQNMMLESLDKQKTNFFQTVSHELRTPLTLIMSPLEEIKKLLSDNQYVELAIKNSNRLYRLVNQLLDFQKVTRAEHSFELKPINLTAFLKVCSDYFLPVCKKRDTSFSVKIDSTQDIIIQAHADALEKIIFNLLSNALKFTKNGDSIQVKLRDMGTEVEISVVDTGIGIAEKDMGKLFNSFSQIEKDLASTKEGTGIGLALVKELAEKLKGSTGASSKGEQLGSTFWVKFPISEKKRKSLDILFVENGIEDLSSLKKISKQENRVLSYDSVTSYNQALKSSKLNRFKCIIFQNDPTSDVLSFYEVMKVEQEFAKFIFVNESNSESSKELDEYKDALNYISLKPADDEMISLVNKFTSEDTLETMSELDLSNFVPKDWHIQEQQKSEIEDITNNSNSEPNLNDAPIVLVVDDLIDMRDLIKFSLDKKGYRIITATDGLNAIDQIKRVKPDLIITDWMMPKMSGIELINELKKDHIYSTIPTVLLTAKSDEESRATGSKIGANAYIGKPFDELELHSVVENLIKLKTREREVEVLNQNITKKYLKRFLPPKLVADILAGHEIFDEKPVVEYLSVVNFELVGIKESYITQGPKETAKVINEYSSAVSKIIYKYGGCISRFDGDVIVAFWGAPVVLEGIHQGKQIFDCVSEIKKEIQTGLVDKKTIELKVAISYDLTLHGNFGSEDRSEYLVLGPNVDLTYQLQRKIGKAAVIFNKGFYNLLKDQKWNSAESITFDDLDKSKIFYKVAR